MRLCIQNGRVIDPLNRIDAVTNVFIAEGKIAALGQAPADFIAEQTINAQGKIVLPGLVDLAVRLREPGYEYLATLESEMAAALAGGVTSLACPPDTDPVLDEPALVEMLKHRARNLKQAKLYPVAALTNKLKGEHLTEMAELIDAGCIAFSQANQPLKDTQVLLRAMQYAATFGFTIWLHPQDSYLSRNGVAHDGEVATRCGLAGIPVCAETIALSTFLILARETGAKLHICRISSAEGVDLVRQAKQQGLPITCDVSMNHVHLSEMDIATFDSNCHLNPPLRSLRDRAAIRAGLIDGTIDAICSNHSPVDDDAKLLPFAESAVGATGVELLLSLVYKFAQDEKLSLLDAFGKIGISAANVLGIAAGSLSIGTDADICIADTSQYWMVNRKALKSQGKNTPFMGLELPCRVETTLINGRVVFQR